MAVSSRGRVGAFTRTTALILVAIILGLVSVACAQKPASQVQDRTNTENQQAVYARNQPVPRFDFSQTRDTLIQIYKLENEARRTFTTFHSNGTGEVIFSCPSRGYAVAADTQLTNPLQPGYTNYVETYVIEQPEPNGVYSSKNTDGTYVLCVRPNGDVTPVYTELKVTTFPYEVEYDAATRQVRDIGRQSSSSITIRQQVDGGSGGTAPPPAPTPMASPSPTP